MTPVVDAFDATGEHQYSLELNASDFHMFVRALQAAYEHTADAGCPDVDVTWSGGLVIDVTEWSADFLSGIASTLGVEFV
ncbi:MAG TPA: hypothetical protein VGL36_35605 [Kribbella sp.]